MDASIFKSPARYFSRARLHPALTLCLSFGLVVLASRAGSAQEVSQTEDSPHSCPDRFRHIEAKNIYPLMSAIQELGIAAFVGKAPGDVMTGDGDLLSETCLAGLDPAQKKKEVLRLESILQEARQSLRSCAQFYGFGPDVRALPQLDRAVVIECVTKKKDDVMATALSGALETWLVKRGSLIGGRSEYRSYAPQAVRLPYGSTQVAVINPAVIRLNVNYQKDNQTWAWRDPRNQNWAAMVIAHELTHFLSNNLETKVHNDDLLQQCGSRSKFRDRNYLVQMACFPLENWFFLNQFCMEDCMVNLTSFPEPGEGNQGNVPLTGPFPVSITYSESEARGICAKMGTVQRLLAARASWIGAFQFGLLRPNAQLVGNSMEAELNALLSAREAFGLGTASAKQKWEIKLRKFADTYLADELVRESFVKHAQGLPAGLSEADDLVKKFLIRQYRESVPNALMLKSRP